MQATLQTEALLYPRSAYSGVVRAAFRGQENGCGSAVLFSSPRFDIEVSCVAACVAAELSHVHDRVLLADGRALFALAHDAATCVERLPVRMSGGRVWALGRQQLADPLRPHKEAAPGRAADVLRALRFAFDHVAIDVSALPAGNMLDELTREAEGTILVLRSGCITEQEVLRCSRRITDAGGRILGSVLTA